MFFAIIPLSDEPEDLIEKIQSIDKGAYVDYEGKVYFLHFSGTAKSLSEMVGFAKEGEESEGVVLKSTESFGFANKSLWRWIGEE